MTCAFSHDIANPKLFNLHMKIHVRPSCLFPDVSAFRSPPLSLPSPPFSFVQKVTFKKSL